MIKPDPTLIPQFYQGYVKHVEHLDLLQALHQGGEAIKVFLETIPEEKGVYRYAPGKWSVKELLCHLMDAERIFAYRALRFAREDKTPLPGYEENDYAGRANAHSRTIVQLSGELQRLRATTLDLFKSFTPEMLELTGQANNYQVSVKNIGFVIAGHEAHHLLILKQRYFMTL